jgi:hypothetical protein
VYAVGTCSAIAIIPQIRSIPGSDLREFNRIACNLGIKINILYRAGKEISYQNGFANRRIAMM